MIASFVYKITLEVDSFDRANMSNNGFIYGLNTHLLDFLASLKKHVSILTQFRNYSLDTHVVISLRESLIVREKATREPNKLFDFGKQIVVPVKLFLHRLKIEILNYD